MRATILFLLPFLGSCRHLAPRGEVSDAKRQIFDGVSSVCYTYTTTYLTTIAAGGTIPPGATVTIPGGTPTGGVTAIPPGQTTPAPSPGSATTIITGDNTIVLSIAAPAPAATNNLAGPIALLNDTGLRKRQTEVVSTGELGYISAGGTTGTCAASRQFTVQNGQLIDVATGVAIAAGTSLQPIDLNDPVSGTYSTEFALSGGVLVWTNAAFYNGAAVFCLLDGVLYASFTAAGPPTGCTIVNLVVVQANVCQDVAMSASISLSLGGSATGSAGVSVPVSGAASISGSAGLSVPVVTPTVTGPVTTTGVAQSIPSATVFVAVGQAIDVDLSLLFDLLGSVASFTTTPSVSWVSLGSGNNNNVLGVNVPATWTVGLNVKVELSVNLGVAQLFIYDLFLDVIAPTATSPGVSVPASQTVTPSVSVSVTGTAPIVTSTPITINVVQGVYYEIDLAAYLLNSGDVPQPPSTIPANLDWVGLFSLVNDLNGLLSYDIHGTVPSDYPVGDVIVNVLVDSQVGANYALQFVLAVALQTSSPSVTLPGFSSTAAIPSLGSFTSGIVLPTAPATISISLEQGQAFDVDLTPYLELATDIIESFTTQPVVDWINFANGGLDTSQLVGTVPLEYPTGAVNVAVKVFGALEYTIPLIFNIVAGPFSITSIAPTAPSPTLPTAATSSAFISGVPAPLTTSVTVYLGQPFEIDLSALFISLDDTVVDLVTSPVVDWVAVGSNAETLIGTVPTVLDASVGSQVQVLETVRSAATGRTYSILVSLNIAQLSGSSSGLPSVVLPTTTPNGLTTPPVVIPSTTLPGLASASSTAPNTFTTDISLVTGEQFDVDLTAIAQAFGALSLDLNTFSLGPLADFVSSPTLEGDNDYHLTGLVPDSTLSGTYSIFIQAQGQFEVTLNIQVNLVVSQGSPSSSNTSPTTPPVGLPTSPVGIPTSTPAIGSPTLAIPTSSAVSTPSLTPIVIGVPVTAGQPFTIDVFDLLDQADIDVASVLNTPVVPDFVTFASTLAGDILFTGTVPVGFTGTPVISFLIEDSADVVSLINLELDIAAPGITTSQILIPSASQTGSSPASSVSAVTNPIFTLASLIPGQTFFYDVSSIVFDATGDAVISLQDPVDQTWINVNQIAGTLEGDQTISGTVPATQALGTYIVTAVVTDAATGLQNIFSLGIFIVSPSASASVGLPSSVSVPGLQLPSSVVTPTQSTAASSTTATPYATIIYLTPGQSFELDADPLVEINGYLNVESITVTPLSAEEFITLSGDVGVQVLTGTIPDDYTPGNTIVVDLLSLGATSVPDDVETYFNVLVELVIVTTLPSFSTGALSPTLPTSIPGFPSASIPGFPSASVPGLPSESGPGFPSASVPGVPSESGPGFPSASVPGFPSASVPGVPSESGPGFPSASVPGFPSASVPGVPSESGPGFPSASVPGFPSTSVPGFPSASASAGPQPTSFTISPFQNFYLPLGVYLQSSTDVAVVASGTVGFSIENGELVVSPSAGLEAGAVATVEVDVSGGLEGPYTLPFTFFVLPSSFSISANQNFDIDLSGYLQAPTDIPSLSSALSGVSLSDDTVTISSLGALLAGTTFTLPILVTPPGGGTSYTLPFTITVLPLSSASFTLPSASFTPPSASFTPPSASFTLPSASFTLPSVNLPSASVPLPSLPSSGVTPATTSGIPVPTAPAALNCQLTGTFPTFAICNIPALQLFSLPIGLYLDASLGANGVNVGIQALLSTSPPVDWLSLDAGSDVLIGTPPANAPATVDVVLSVTLGTSTYTLQIELDINGGLPQSTIALPSVPFPSASLAPVPTPINCRPATDNLLATAICDVTQNQYFSLPLLGYLTSGATLLSLESEVNVALNTGVQLTWLGLSTSVLSGYPPLGITGEYLIEILYSSGGTIKSLFIEINVLPQQSTSTLAAPSFTLPGPAASSTGAAALPSSTTVTFLEQQGSEVDILLSSLIPALATITDVTVTDLSGQPVDGLSFDGVDSLVGTLPSNLLGTLSVVIQALTAADLPITIPAVIIILPTGGAPSTRGAPPTGGAPPTRGAPPTGGAPPTSTGSGFALPTAPPSLTFTIPVVSGRDSGIDLTQYLQGSVSNVNSALVSLTSVVPQVDWFSLNDLLLSADIPAGATGTVSATFNVQVSVSISFNLVLNFLIVAP